ncbi:MAG: hypothetical protein IKK79_01120 [Spirochaetaceae bacterium]|nr:hypothetical protein [Spirochaetaceae bacterium]MBR6565392.1 hypothetical protein [Spirochaetaceae bacterium]
MVKKKVFLSLVLLCVVSIPSLTAWVMAHERVWIRNELDEPISVYCEFQHQGDVSYPEYWKQSLGGKEIESVSLFDTGEKKMYKAKSRIRLVEYTPLRHEVFSEDLAYLKELPLEQKLKELFKTLVISDAEGRVLLTLEDFSKARVEIGSNGRRYDIIIGDYLYQ